MLAVVFRNNIQILADQGQQFATRRPVEGIVRVAGWCRIQNNIFIFTRMASLHRMVHIDEMDRPGDVNFVRHGDTIQNRSSRLSMRGLRGLRDTIIQLSPRTRRRNISDQISGCIFYINSLSVIYNKYEAHGHQITKDRGS